MKLTKRAYLSGIIVGMCLFGFQNCSQPGDLSMTSKFSTNAAGIPGGSDNTDGPNSGNNSDPGSGIDDGSGGEAKTPGQIIDSWRAVCNSSEAFSAPSQNLQLNSASQVVKLDAYNIQTATISSSTVVIRNPGGDGVVGQIQVDNSTLVLCGYTSFVSIKGKGNVVVVIGGAIQTLALSNSAVYLANASVEISDSASSIIHSVVK